MGERRGKLKFFEEYPTKGYKGEVLAQRELANGKIHRLRELICSLEDDVRGYQEAGQHLASQNARLRAKLEAAEKAIAEIVDAWECSDGGGGGVESIATAIDAAREVRGDGR